MALTAKKRIPPRSLGSLPKRDLRTGAGRRIGVLRRPSPFASLTRGEALAKVIVAEVEAEAARLNRLFYDGDHWQDGEGWIGPIPAIDHRTYDEVKEEIHRIFNSRNIVKEVVDRPVDSLLKSKPRTDYVRAEPVTDDHPLSPEDEALMEEAHTLFMEWADKRDLLRILKEVLGRSYLGEKVVARLYIPKGRLEQRADGTLVVPEGLSLSEYLDLIHINLIVDGNAGQIVDDDSQLTAMVSDVRQGNTRYTEIVYVDGDETVVRTINETVSDTIVVLPSLRAAADQDLGTVWKLKLGKRSTMFEPRVRTIVTQQVRENQCAINLTKTMQGRNIITAGFLERLIMDAMPPGKWVPNPDKPGEDMYEVGPFKVGGGTTNFFMAAEYRNAQTGETHHGAPRVYFHEPSSPDTFIASKRDCVQDILEEVNQVFVLIAGDATASAISRETSKAEYHAKLEDDEGELNKLVRWLMDTPLAMACFFAKQVGHFDTLKSEAQCFITTGPLTGTERQDLREDVSAGLKSRATAMSRDGIEDPKAEMGTIDEEESNSDEALEKKCTIIQLLVASGSSLEGACLAAGLDPVIIKKMVTSGPDPRANEKDPKADPVPAGA